MGIRDTNIKGIIHHLKKIGWIEPIIRGVYVLRPILLSGVPIHEFEIISYILKGCMISHFSAFSHHHLTDQVLREVFVTTTKRADIPGVRKGELSLRGVRYTVIRTKEELFFGGQKVWVGGTRVLISDLERTLIDGLSTPKHCGGFSEVMHGFEIGREKFDINKLIEYATRYSPSLINRLGWVLEEIGMADSIPKNLSLRIGDHYVDLDASSISKGPYNKHWKVRVNL